MQNKSDIQNNSIQFKVKSSFDSVTAAVKEQIEFDCFAPEDMPDAEAVCLIIAEVYFLPPAAMVRIKGNDLPAEAVQAIFHKLTHEHIELVLDNLARTAYEIKHITTYIRTALYSSVFEMHAHYENAFRRDNPQTVKQAFGRKGANFG